MECTICNLFGVQTHVVSTKNVNERHLVVVEQFHCVLVILIWRRTVSERRGHFKLYLWYSADSKCFILGYNWTNLLQSRLPEHFMQVWYHIWLQLIKGDILMRYFCKYATNFHSCNCGRSADDVGLSFAGIGADRSELRYINLLILCSSYWYSGNLYVILELYLIL